MKRETPFKLAAKNTLRVTERDAKADKALLHTLQGGHDLHTELTKTFLNNKNKQTSLIKPLQTTKELHAKQKSEDQALSQQVAALDNFKTAVTRQKTKILIQNIKLRRREKHLQSLSDFKQDLQDYKQNLYAVYASLQSDLTQVLSIRQTQLTQYLTTSSKESYLLSKDKQLIAEIQKQVEEYQQSIIQRIRQSEEELQRIRNDRKGLVQNKAGYLQMQLIQIAFVLEDQAKEIVEKQKNNMEDLQLEIYEKKKKRIEQIRQEQSKLFQKIKTQSDQIQKKWKQLNQQHQIASYIEQTNQLQYRWPQKRKNLYQSLVLLQTQNSQRKHKLLINLTKQHPDTITKSNIEKWSDHLKIINQFFNEAFDKIIKDFMDEGKENEDKNKSRLERLRNRLIFIQNRDKQQVEKLVNERCNPNYERNIEQSKNILKNVTNYVEDGDEKENNALEKLATFLGELGSRTDDFSKKWIAFLQQYEVNKAKVLDEDDEVVEKLTGELTSLKKQLRQSLHHIKLQELQKACFEKIDQLEKSYRKTHQDNKDIIAKRPANINKFMNDFEAKVAEIFSLYDQSKRAELIEKAKKECQELATKRYQEEEKKKLEQEAIAIEQAKKKGGKPPPPAKPKDPKKAQAQMQQRKKVLMQQIGLRQIQQVKTQSGSVWLAFSSLLQICRQFYKKQDASGGDQLGQQITNFKGQTLVTKKALISSKEMSNLLQKLRNNLFQKLGQKKQRILQQAEIIDNIFLEQSLTNLDSRLREHYPLKGKLQAQIGVVRSGEITSHKKQYQKQVRTVKEKMDLQTEKFNYLLEKCLQLIKTHNTDQKVVKEQLSQGKMLSDYQGCYRKAHENYKNFTRETQQIGKQLLRLSSVQVQAILNSNQDYLKHSIPLTSGGQFSQSELDWYRNMMTQINGQINQQKDKRSQKGKEVQDHIQKRSKQLIELFDKEYNIYLEKLSANEGTGKKYGKPKRTAQQKLRLQMNKCEQAQINIDKQINNLLQLCSKECPAFPVKPGFMLWRQRIVTLQNCICRYAKHIEAIVNPCKARLMPRVTRIENVCDALLAPEQEEEDKKRITQQLLQLGPLGQQKQDKVFMKFLEDIQKIICDEARQIYKGDKADLLKGTDKVPDFLRLYIQNMRKNAEQFRQQSVRHLRESCNKLSTITDNIIQLIYRSLETYFGGSQSSIFRNRRKQLQKLLSEHQKQRQLNLKQLRPNLSNPKCQQQLKLLDQRQKKRQQQFIVLIKQLRKGFQDEFFTNASLFLQNMLNNYEFLILFFDSLYLPQDFVSVAGDDVQQKIHLDAKRLLLMKQKGITIDANSQRNIKKKWEPVLCTLFNFGDKKFVIANKVQEQPKDKDKKGAKKDSKAQKVEEQAPTNPDQSKIIQTHKTWRQKAVFTNRDNILTSFSKQYHHYLDQMIDQLQKNLKLDDSFRLKWSAIAKTLYVT